MVQARFRKYQAHTTETYYWCDQAQKKRILISDKWLLSREHALRKQAVWWEEWHVARGCVHTGRPAANSLFTYVKTKRAWCPIILKVGKKLNPVASADELNVCLLTGPPLFASVLAKSHQSMTTGARSYSFKHKLRCRPTCIPFTTFTEPGLTGCYELLETPNIIKNTNNKSQPTNHYIQFIILISFWIAFYMKMCYFTLKKIILGKC